MSRQLGWQRCLATGNCPKPRADSNAVIAATPFSTAYDAAARDGKLWVRFAGRTCSTQDADSCRWTEKGAWSELVLKGVSWSGFQIADTNCVEELGGFQYPRDITEYLNVLSANGFNAVRLPVYAQGVLEDPVLNSNRCGRLARANNRVPVKHYHAALKEVIGRLRGVGAYVMLDMHSLHGESNQPNWCGAAVCTAANEAYLVRAWTRLATEYCSDPNVLIADLFNEPYGATWGEWSAAAARIGDAVLAACPRWLIGVQGVGAGDGECQRYGGTSCWWGENILGQLAQPVALRVPERLVLLPHTYGHDDSKPYMRDAAFPANLPAVWDALWGRVAARRAAPVVVGEWGGRYEGASAQWQHALQAYLAGRRASHFFYALNANSHSVGGLYPYDADHGRETLAMLASSPATSVRAAQLAALCASTPVSPYSLM